MPFHIGAALVCWPAYPAVSGSLFSIYIVGRFLYTAGYATGNPNLRLRGVIGYIGTLGLMALCVASAVSFFRSTSAY